jgi:hypothetical protein
MQGVRGSNPLSSTPGQRPSPPSTAYESPASGSKSAAICPERPIQRPVGWCRRPASLALSRGRPGLTQAGGLGRARRRIGSAGHGKMITGWRADLIRISALHVGRSPPEHLLAWGNDSPWLTAGHRWTQVERGPCVDQGWGWIPGPTMAPWARRSLRPGKRFGHFSPCTPSMSPDSRSRCMTGWSGDWPRTTLQG